MSTLHSMLTRIALQELTGQAYVTVEDQALAMAAAIINNAEGYAVVELPKMVGVNGCDNAVWCREPYIEQEFNGDVVISDRLGIDKSDLLKVAASLLAANVTEAGA